MKIPEISRSLKNLRSVRHEVVEGKDKITVAIPVETLDIEITNLRYRIVIIDGRDFQVRTMERLSEGQLSVFGEFIPPVYNPVSEIELKPRH